MQNANITDNLVEVILRDVDKLDEASSPNQPVEESDEPRQNPEEPV